MQYFENAKMGGGPDCKIWCIVDSNQTDYMENVVQWMIEQDTEGRFVKVADTLEELAAAAELPADNLKRTVEKWNEYSKKGVDPDFDRRTDFGPIETGPFYAIRIVQNPLGACGGLRTDIETRVLNTAGEPIERLFAAGQIASGMFTGPFYPGCGWAVLGTVHWGRKAGRNAAALDARA